VQGRRLIPAASNPASTVPLQQEDGKPRPQVAPAGTAHLWQGTGVIQHYGKFPISRFLSNREIGKKCAWPLAWGAGGCGVDSEDGLSGSLTAERLGGEW